MGRDSLILRPEQVDLIQNLREADYELGYFLVIWLMREGKTAPVLEYLVQTDYTDILVVCPPNVIHVWEKELRRHKKDRRYFTIISDSERSINNYVSRIMPDCIVVDEIHRFRAYSERYKALVRLSRYTSFRIGMTGTPIDQYLSELYYPLQWLSDKKFFGLGKGEAITSKKVFESVYCSPITPGYKHTKYEINPAIREDFKKEIMKVASIFKSGNVHEARHERVTYPLTAEQMRMIETIERKDEFKKGDVLNDVFLEATTAIRRDKIRQVYGGFIYHDADVVKTWRTWKWIYLCRLIRDLGGRRTVIWYKYTYEMNRIMDMLSQYHIEEYSTHALSRFNDGELDILVCHPASAGAGVDISHAQYAVFISYIPKWIDVMQAFYRLSKYGEKSDKVIYHLLADHSQDHEDFEKMANKRDATMEIYDAPKS